MNHIKLFETYKKENESLDLSAFYPEAINSLLSRDKGFSIEDLEKYDGRTRNLILHYYESGYIAGKRSMGWTASVTN